MKAPFRPSGCSPSSSVVVHPCSQCLCAAKSPVGTDDDASWGCYAIGDAAADCDSKEGQRREHAPDITSICRKRSVCVCFPAFPPCILCLLTTPVEGSWLLGGGLFNIAFWRQREGCVIPPRPLGDVSHHDNSQRLLMQPPTWDMEAGWWGSWGKVFALVFVYFSAAVQKEKNVCAQVRPKLDVKYKKNIQKHYIKPLFSLIKRVVLSLLYAKSYKVRFDLKPIFLLGLRLYPINSYSISCCIFRLVAYSQRK